MRKPSDLEYGILPLGETADAMNISQIEEPA